MKDELPLPRHPQAVQLGSVANQDLAVPFEELLGGEDAGGVLGRIGPWLRGRRGGMSRHGGEVSVWLRESSGGCYMRLRLSVK